MITNAHQLINETATQQCEDTIPSKRAVEYDLCIFCAEELERQARLYKPRQTRTIAPMHKSNYMLITNLDDLRGINSKGGQVR